MKKLITIFLLSTLFISCKKEEVKPQAAAPVKEQPIYQLPYGTAHIYISWENYMKHGLGAKLYIDGKDINETLNMCAQYPSCGDIFGIEVRVDIGPHTFKAIQTKAQSPKTNYTKDTVVVIKSGSCHMISL